MSNDRLISYATGDVQAAAAGGFVLADDLVNKIIMSYSIPLGTWEGDPTLGHRFDELARAIDTPDTRKRLADLAAQAVQWLLDSGELDSVEVDVMSYAPTIVAFQPRCYQPGATKPVAGVGLQFVSVGG